MRTDLLERGGVVGKQPALRAAGSAGVSVGPAQEKRDKSKAGQKRARLVLKIIAMAAISNIHLGLFYG